MSLPINDRNEYPISSIGAEVLPQNIIVKSSLWVAEKIHNRFYLKNYDGNIFRLNFYPDVFSVSPALQPNKSLYNDRFWVWSIVDNDLTLYEIEPFNLSSPTIHQTKLLLSDVVYSSPYVVAGTTPKIMALVNSPSDALKIVVWNDIWTDPPVLNSDLYWQEGRDSIFSSWVNSTKTLFKNFYVYAASPLNVYDEDFVLSPPDNLLATHVEATLDVHVNWDGVTESDVYALERSDTSTFPVSTTTEVYRGSLISYIDTVPSADTWWYRVKSIAEEADIESGWSLPVSVFVFAPIVANFVGSPLIGVDTLDVNFTSTSIGFVTTWFWEFGDTSTSALPNPSHLYTDVGQYTVKLTITGPGGSDYEEKYHYVAITPSAPTADFTATPTLGAFPLVVSFTDASTSVHTITSWFWDFGDGYTSTEQNPTHTYNLQQPYTVSLTVTNSYGLSDTEVKNSFITVTGIGEVIAFTAVPLEGSSPLTVKFTNLSTIPPGYTVRSWRWDFGDGEGSSEVSPIHTYIQHGFHTVKLCACIGII